MTSSTYYDSIIRRKTIHVPVELGEVVYVNDFAPSTGLRDNSGLPIPGRRQVTEIKIAENGIFITVTNRRTGESTVYRPTDFGKTVFVDIFAARAAMTAT